MICMIVALPKIITHPMNLTVEVNNDTTNVQLHCMANGAVSYQWEKQNDVIPTDVEGVNNRTLTLIGITPRDGGQYRCVAINEHGRNYSNYGTVIITGKNAQLTKCTYLIHVHISSYMYSVYTYILSTMYCDHSNSTSSCGECYTFIDNCN